MFYVALFLVFHVFSYGASLDSSDPLQQNKEQMSSVRDSTRPWPTGPFKTGEKNDSETKPASDREKSSDSDILHPEKQGALVSDTDSAPPIEWRAEPVGATLVATDFLKSRGTDARGSVPVTEGKPSSSKRGLKLGAVGGEEVKPVEKMQEDVRSEGSDKALTLSQGSEADQKKENKPFSFVTSRADELSITSAEGFIYLSYFGENSKVENTALGKAVARGDRETYLKALTELAQHGIEGKRLLSVYHHLTSDGKTLLELMVRVPENHDFFTHELAGVLSAIAAAGGWQKNFKAENLTFLIQVAQETENKPAFVVLSRLKKLLLEFEKHSVREKITALKEKRKFLRREYLSSLDSVFVKFPLIGVVSLVMYHLPVEAFEFFVGLISEAVGLGSVLSSDLSSEAKVVKATAVGGGVLSGAYLFIHNSLKCMDVFSSRKALKKDITHSESYLKTL